MLSFCRAERQVWVQHWVQKSAESQLDFRLSDAESMDFTYPTGPQRGDGKPPNDNDGMSDGQATVPSKKRNSRSETQISPPPFSGQGDELDFHANVARQPSHLDGGAGRRVRREIAAIDFVHGGEVGKVLEEYRRFHH